MLLPAVAWAIPTSGFTATVEFDGNSEVFNETMLGCTSTGTDTFNCIGGAANGDPSVASPGGYDYQLDTWNMNLDVDPIVNGVIGVTNLSNSTQTFTLTVFLPVAPLGPTTLMGGSMQGGVTDNNGDGATLSTVAASAYYMGLIDGLPVGAPAVLYPDPPGNVTAAGPFLSNNVPAASFGTPIPSAAGPAVANSIGIKFQFDLSAHDSATFTGVFVVEPIPEPVTATLLGFGLVGLAIASRRRV